jgi:hypothetical protein
MYRLFEPQLQESLVDWAMPQDLAQRQFLGNWQWRVAIGGFYHETNTFSVSRTGLELFKAYQDVAAQTY